MSLQIIETGAASLDRLDKEHAEAAVTQMLTAAGDWMTKAIAATSTVTPAEVKNARGAVYTIREAARQKGLSESIRSDAEEMARRSDYTLNKAIRAGQANHDVFESSIGGDRASAASDGDERTKLSDLLSPGEWRGGRRGEGVRDLDCEPDEFEEALAQAKAEDNLSRANVARKITAKKNEAEPVTAPPKKAKGTHGRIRSAKRTGAVLTNTLGTLDAIQIAIDPIEDLSTLTDEEAARIRGGFQKAVRSLNRIINLTKGNQS